MRQKRDKNRTYETTGDTILIPELEEASRVFVPHEWSARDKEILKRYYGKVPMNLLMKHLPGKTKAAIRSKVQNMGLLERKA